VAIDVGYKSSRLADQNSSIAEVGERLTGIAYFNSHL